MLSFLFLFGGLGVLAVMLSLTLPHTAESNNVLIQSYDFQADQS
jgi:hypothetical protein